LKTSFIPFEDESEFDVERFLEAILPRPKSALAILIYRDIDHLPNARSVAPDPGDCSNQAYTEACKRNVTEFMEQLNTGRSFDNLYDNVYSTMIDDELRMLYCLRKINNRKSKHRDQENVIYCICRQPGYSGFMLQCELCRDWFHKKCVGFSSKNVDISRLRYVCPHCERTSRPELAEVISILKELVPHFLGLEDEGDEDVPSYRLGDWSKSLENIGSELISALSSIPFLLKFPLLTAIQLACERAFIFASRAKDVIDKQRELWELLREYEAFSGVKIQWQNYNETAILAAPRPNRQQHHQQRGQAVGSSLSRSHLPPNVTRPPGMQPLVLRTSAPRSLVTSSEERLQQLRRQQQFEGKLYQQSTNKNQQQANCGNNKSEDLETSELRKEQNEKEAAVALAIMSSAEPSTTPQAKSPFTSSGASPPYITNQPRRRIPSGEVNRRELETDLHRSPPHFRMPNTAGGPSSSLVLGRSPLPPSTFRYSIHPEARYCLNNLLGEACALEMSMPQTRWLWQMNLAVDPDCEGALHPRIICAEETAIRRRGDRRRAGGGFVGTGNEETVSRYQRPRRQNFVVASSEKPFYATLAHKGREGLDSYECLSKKRRLSNTSHGELLASQRRRGKPCLRGAMASSSRRGLPVKPARISARQSKQEQASDTEKQEDDEMEEEVMKQTDSPSPSLASEGGKSRRGRISREHERMLSSHSEEDAGSISRRREVPAFGSSSGLRGRRSAGNKHARDFRSLVKAAQRDVAAARRFAVSHRRRGSASRGRGGAGRPRGSLSRQLYQKQYQQRRRSRQGAVNREEEYEEELCEAPGGCKRPSGSVSWVACDQCDSWYHQRCVGIMNAREVPEVYVCSNCQANNSVTRKEAFRSQKFRTARGGRWKKMCDVEMPLSDFEVEEEMDEVDENGPPSSKQSRIDSPESVPSTSKPAVNVEGAGAEALLAAIEVLDAIPQSMETKEVAARTENVMNDNLSPSSHQPESDEKFE
uniref:PHD-type domain-containing protein n=3 Tax=Hymenolepis diminuta TaxID=6216 RepID=A0A0R3SA43_HYMDI